MDDMGVKIKKGWDWAKSIWQMASNITKVLDDQKEIKERLDKIEEAIKSPQYQVAELQKIKLNVDLVKENYEEEIKRLKTGSQEEIVKHKTKIEGLEKINTELSEYKNLVSKAIEVIEAKDLKIKELNEELEKLKKKAPLSLSEILAGNILGAELPPYPYEPLFQSILGRTNVPEKDK